MSSVCDLSSVYDFAHVDLTFFKQKTLKKSVSAEGIGLFSGKRARFVLNPAPEGHGIVFERVDLPSPVLIPANTCSVQATPRCTVIGKEGVFVQTVEHLLAALAAYRLDNVHIEITAEEVPVFDGSAKAFTDLIEEAGVLEQEQQRPLLSLKKPLYWSEGKVHLVALPSDEYRISYTLHYPHCPVIGTQFYTFALSSSDDFRDQIASCRTFSIYEEILPMIEKGLVKGGSLETAVLVKEGCIANPEGLRFQDEMVRHKVLDLMGDLSLLPPFKAHIIAICSGHTSNYAFAKQFLNHVKEEM